MDWPHALYEHASKSLMEICSGSLRPGNRKADQGTNLIGFWEKTSEQAPDVSRASGKAL